MISPFLPIHAADAVTLDFGVFIAEQARTHRVSQTAILAALRPCITPSQPEGSSSPHAPAAQTDGEASPQAAPSVAPNSPETAPRGEGAEAPAAGESPVIRAAGDTGAQLTGGEDVAPPDDTQRTQTLDAAAQGSTLTGETAGSAVGAGAHISEAQRYAFERVRAEFEADPSRTNKEIAHAAKCNMARANAWLKQMRADRVANTTTALVAQVAEVAKPKAAPKPMAVKEKLRAINVEAPDRITLKQRVAEVHEQYPDWTAKAVAQHLGEKFGSVKSALFDAKMARLSRLQAVEAVPAPNPQKPVAPPPPPTGGTLRDRVRIVHSQHPTWTAALIGKHLGANANSVSTYLAQIRSNAEPAPAAPARVLPNGRAGEIEAQTRAEAAARAARLGKPS